MEMIWGSKSGISPHLHHEFWKKSKLRKEYIPNIDIKKLNYFKNNYSPVLNILGHSVKLILTGLKLKFVIKFYG
jgi:hypothetical protein